MFSGKFCKTIYHYIGLECIYIMFDPMMV